MIAKRGRGKTQQNPKTPPPLQTTKENPKFQGESPTQQREAPAKLETLNSRAKTAPRRDLPTPPAGADESENRRGKKLQTLKKRREIYDRAGVRTGED